jgi:transcriptional regulator with XRE-family HTH domain
VTDTISPMNDPILTCHPDLVALGRFIRERRSSLELTQTQVADRLGWKQERISILENSRYGLPSVPTLARLAAALDVSLSDLLGTAGFRVEGTDDSNRTESNAGYPEPRQTVP